MSGQNLYEKSVGFIPEWDSMSLVDQKKWIDWSNRTSNHTYIPSTEATLSDSYAAQALLRAGFLYNLDIVMVVDVDSLLDWGGPQHLQVQNKGQLMVLNLEAAFHAHNKVIFHNSTLEITLSFDTVYRCCIPYNAFRQITFGIVPDKDDEVA
jgi:hypothetical protein